MSAHDETLDHPPHVTEAATLVRLLDAYLEDLQAGRAPDRDRLLAEHPELASCLAGLEFIHRAATDPEAEAPARLGDFRIVREVGRGGMGVVYEAEQLSLRRRVALKVLRYGPVAEPEAMERFRREAETVAYLHHTNIVPIFALGDEKGVHYYAMQFIEGRSLAEVLDTSRRERRPLPCSDVAAWALQTAEALDYAHKRGVIHRDIKPSNLLLDPDGLVWLTDFGLARRIDEAALTVTGALLGTPRYMSPEQAAALGRPIDARTDLYSLGASLYELATGRPLFDADSPHAMLAQILNVEPVRPRQARPDLPRDLETIILKCLAKEPSGRYQSAQALADDLRAHLDGRPIRARRLGPVRRAARWAKRHRKTAAVATVSAVVVFAALGVWNLAQTINQGSVRLLTDIPQLTAEILDADTGAVVRPELSLPTRQPLALSPGAYRVNLAAEGRPAESYRLDVARGESVSYHVAPASRRPWEPFEVHDQDLVEPIALEGPREDLIVVRTGSIRRLDGATGRLVWTFGDPDPNDATLDSTRQNAPSPESINEANRLRTWIFGLQNDSTPAALLRPAPDLDGDGTGDLVWAYNIGARLWAVSGRGDHGATRELWSFDRGPGTVLGPLESADLDGDGSPEILATFQQGSHRWVEAVAGRTGQPIWSHDLDPSALWSTSARGGRVGQAPAIVVREGTRPVVVVGEGGRILRLDAASGEPVGSIDLGAPILGTLRPTDLDGDGGLDLIAVVEAAPLAGDTVVAVDLLAGRVRWLHPLQSSLRQAVATPIVPVDWPLVEDLDGDGQPEVVVPARDPRQPSGSYDWVGLEVLGGVDGRPRWRRLLTPSKYVAQADRFVAGPDLDGDGVRDLFVATVSSEWRQLPGEGDEALNVDALSGRDGRTLWWWRRPVTAFDDMADAPRWWGPGADGWPRLVVPVMRFAGRDPEIAVLSAGTGRLAFALPSARSPHVGDLDGDGLPDLSYRVGAVSTGDGARFAAVLGEPPTRWARLGALEPVGDLDGDGVTDLVEPRPDALAAVSGLDGRRLWRSAMPPEPGGSNGVLWEPIPGTTASLLDPVTPAPDLDGDGTPDLLVGVTQSLGRSGPSNEFVPLPVRALSGRDGRTLWEMPPVRVPGLVSQVFAVPLLARIADLDDDGTPEVLTVFHAGRFTFAPSLPPRPDSDRIWLAWTSGRDGRLLRLETLAESQPNGVSHNLDQYREPPVLADLDGDSRLDVLVMRLATEPDGTYTPRLFALSGLDGSTLWTHRLTNRGGFRGTSLDLPDPLVGDLDGDGAPEVVLGDSVDPAHPEAPGDNVEIVALEGRTGRPVWEPWRTRDDQLPIVLLPDPALVRTRDGRATVAVRAARGDSDVLTLLDARGQVVGERVFERKGSGPWRFEIRAADLDGDGDDDLVVPLGSWQSFKVVALDGRLDHVAWEWSAESGRVLGVRPAAAGHAAEVLVSQPADHLLALSGLDGRPLWRGSGVAFRPFGMIADAPALLAPARPGVSPGVLARALDSSLALATLPAGPVAPGLVLPGSSPLPGPAPDDPRIARPLPWEIPFAEPEVFGPLASSTLAAAACAGLVLGIIPRLRRRRVRLGAFLLVPVACGLTFATVRAWGLDALAHAATLTVAGLPIVTFLGLAVRWTLRRRWRRLALLGALWLLAAPAVAAVLIRVDRPRLEPWQHYRLEGWPLVFLPAAYAAGLALLAALLIRALGRGLMPLFRLVARPSTTPGRP